MKKTLLTLTLISFATLPAFAAKQTFTCEQSVDANGNITYVPLKTQKTASVKHKAKRHHRVARAKAHPIHRDESKTVSSAPVVVQRDETPTYTPSPSTTTDEPIVRTEPAQPRNEDTYARTEERTAWWKRHAVNHPIYGNMARAPGDSSLAYMHGTDNPFGKIAFNSDIGPSAERYHNTATGDQSDEF